MIRRMFRLASTQRLARPRACTRSRVSLAAEGIPQSTSSTSGACRPQCVLDLCDYLHKLMVA
eukprot:5256488-Prymnesium_polylepis.1